MSVPASAAAVPVSPEDRTSAELIELVAENARQDAHLPELADASSDCSANAPQLKVSINRDQAARFDISPQLIDDTLNDAYGQRRSPVFHSAQHLFRDPRNPARSSDDLASLDRLYVKSPLTGGAVPLSALVDVDTASRSALGDAPSPIPVGDADVQSQVGRGARPGVDAITAAARLGMPRRCWHRSRAMPRRSRLIGQHAVLILAAIWSSI